MADVTAASARRWLEGFEAADRARLDAARAQGPRPEWSIRLALSLYGAARAAARGATLADSRRVDQEEAVRRVWDRLRSRLRP